MLKIEIFYDGSVDTETPDKAEELKGKYGDKIDLYLMDVSEETAPESYGTINPPMLFIGGKQSFKLEGPDSMAHIIKHAIF